MRLLVVGSDEARLRAPSICLFLVLAVLLFFVHAFLLLCVKVVTAQLLVLVLIPVHRAGITCRACLRTRSDRHLLDLLDRLDCTQLSALARTLMTWRGGGGGGGARLAGAGSRPLGHLPDPRIQRRGRFGGPLQVLEDAEHPVVAPCQRMDFGPQGRHLCQQARNATALCVLRGCGWLKTCAIGRVVTISTC